MEENPESQSWQSMSDWIQCSRHNINHGAEIPVHPGNKRPLKPGVIPGKKIVSTFIKSVHTETMSRDPTRLPNKASVSLKHPTSSDRAAGSIPEPVQERRKAAVFPLWITGLRPRAVVLAGRRRPPSGAAGTFF